MRTETPETPCACCSKRKRMRKKEREQRWNDKLVQGKKTKGGQTREGEKGKGEKMANDNVRSSCYNAKQNIDLWCRKDLN